jgi:hypothetical protein
MNIKSYLETLTDEQRSDLIPKLAWDVNFGCWTRTGLELIVWPIIRERATWGIYIDMDLLHFANDKFGPDEVDRRFRSALQLRSSDAGAIGRWRFGDELYVILCDYDDRSPTDPAAFAQRFQRALNDVDLSATFGISRILSYDLTANVDAAYRHVAHAKKHKKRGTINKTGPLEWMWGA